MMKSMLNFSQNDCQILNVEKWQPVNPHNTSYCRKIAAATTDALIHKVFSNIAENYKNHLTLKARAILSLKNNDVNAINFVIQNEIPSEVITYEPIDIIINQDKIVNYLTKFLKSLDLSGIPLYVLTFKTGMPIILFQNINLTRLCNGTRLSVKNMINHIKETTFYRRECTAAKNYSQKYTIRIQKFPSTTRICNDNQQITRTIITNVQSTWLYVETSDLFVYAQDRKTLNTAYSKTLQ